MSLHLPKSKNNPTKAKKKNALPVELAAVPFDNISGWLSAYQIYEPAVVLRAVMVAFRRRYMVSQKDAAYMIGASGTSWCHWESGKKTMRPHSKKTLIINGHFKPQHFGLPASAEQFISEVAAMEGARV